MRLEHRKSGVTMSACNGCGRSGMGTASGAPASAVSKVTLKMWFLAEGGSVIKYNFALNVLKDTYDHSCY
jgi:hypothetical protein